jgi:hypothetical protein
VKVDELDLLSLGRLMDEEPPRPSGKTSATFVAERWLHVRDREGLLCKLVPNPAQQRFEAAASVFCIAQRMWDGATSSSRRARWALRPGWRAATS